MEADGEPRGQRVAVRHDDQHGLLRVVQLEEQRRDGVGRLGVEVARRLVAQQQLRLSDQRARDGDALFLAAGQLRGPMTQAAAEPDAIEQRLRARRRLRVGRADQRRHQHVLEHRTLRQQRVILEDESDPAIAKRRQRVCA